MVRDPVMNVPPLKNRPVETATRLAQSLSGRFTSPLRFQRVAAQLGVWLGISFTVAFVTGARRGTGGDPVAGALTSAPALWTLVLLLALTLPILITN